MIIEYSYPQDCVYNFDKPLNYKESHFISGEYIAEMKDGEISIKCFIPASCFVDGAEFIVISKSQDTLYYEGQFKYVDPNPVIIPEGETDE
jgi:hypothetical protein